VEIQIDPHAQARAAERGASLDEIHEVVSSGLPEPARDLRLAKAKVFPFGRERAGRPYPEKRVRVIHLVDHDVVTVVTVYVYYGKWN
jgi:hypothetical protein